MNLKKLILITPMALLFMSAEKSCQQANTARSLKKIVQIERINAAPILVRDESFDYEYVANNQLPGVLFDTNLFFHRAHMPGQDGSLGVGRDGDSGYFGVSKITSEKVEVSKIVNSKVVDQLKTWYPSQKVETLQISQQAACMVSRPQYRLAGSINAMEIWGGGKLQLGFSETVTKIPVGGSFSVDKARMAISMVATNPFTDEVVGAVNASATKTDYSVKIGIDLGIIHIGPEFYKKTGMSEVTEKGLRNGLQAVHNLLSRDPWYTRVFLNKDREVVIVGGSELGLMEGDQFKVTNEAHVWRGVPCGATSIYEGSYPTDRTWTVEIVAVGDGFSRAKVLAVREDDNIEAGARVTLLKLFDPNAKKEAGSTTSSLSQKVNTSTKNSTASPSSIVGTIR